MDAHFRTPYRDKIKSIDDIHSIVGNFPRDRKVVMCHGTFDIVHPGHIRHLMYAKEKGAILVASLTADQHITKANIRPYVPEQLRAENLAAFEMVDYVVVDRDPTAVNNIKALKPDYFAKGFEYSGSNKRTDEEIDALHSYGGEIIFTPGDVVYSSSALIDKSPPNLAVETLMAAMESEGIGFNDLRSGLDALAGLKIHVLGDTIVDTLTASTLIGTGTKTPTPSVQLMGQTHYSGGAAIVAKHLRAAGAQVTFSTVIGDDSHGKHVLDDLRSEGIEVWPVFERGRPTTNKNAVVASGYRLIKLDTVDNRPIQSATVNQFQSDLASLSPQTIALFSDFRHGIFNKDTIPELTGAIPESLYRVADSQVATRWGNILDFKDFDLITPNERETRFALGDQDSVIRPLASRLYTEARCKTLIMKLGDRGILTQRAPLNENPKAFYAIPSFAENVLDPVGAGDALLAYATLALKATGSDMIASILGSMAAAIECEHDGNIPVSPDDMRRKIDVTERKAKLT